MKAYSREEGLQKMAALCARSEQCSTDIAAKLSQHGLTSAEVRSVVAELKERRFIDDLRFCRAFANDKVRFAGWGRLKIRAALCAKHIDSADISEALAAIDESEYSSALERAALAKMRVMGTHDYPAKMKLMRHMAARGFEIGLVSATVDKLWDRDVEGAVE